MKNVQLRISRKKLLHNFLHFKSKLSPSTKLLILVKANGYGLGDLEVASLAKDFGADYLAVAFPCEGIKLTKAGCGLPIIILTPGIDNFEQILDYGLEPSIVNLSSLKSVTNTAASMAKSGYPIHLKLDTGMQRVGFDQIDIEELTGFLDDNPYVRVKSIFSHLAAADEPRHDSFTLEQIKCFCDMAEKISDSLGYSPMKHILNSAGIERFAEAQMDMVRLGIGLYGTSCIDTSNLLPPASMVAPVIHVKDVTGGTIGYGRHGKVEGDVTRIATVAAGYADGVDRRLSRGSFRFMLNGTLVPTIGNVSMDTFMVDVSGLDVKPGDEVTIFGDNPNPVDMAKFLQTISYEVLTSVSSRVERVIVD